MMADCQNYQMHISALIDEQISDHLIADVKNHIQACSLCNKEFKELHSIHVLIKKGLKENQANNLNIWPRIKDLLNNNCELITKEISAFSDQALTEQRQRDITNHLIKCAQCSGIFSQQSQIRKLLKEFYKPAIATEIALFPNIQSRLRLIPFKKSLAKEIKAPVFSPKIFTAIFAFFLLCIFLYPVLHLISKIKLVPAEEIMLNEACQPPSKFMETVLNAR